MLCFLGLPIAPCATCGSKISHSLSLISLGYNSYLLFSTYTIIFFSSLLFKTCSQTGGTNDNRVYTKTEANTALAGKANTAALADKLNVDGTNISDDFVTALTTGGTDDNRVYTKKAADTAFVKAKELATKVAEKAVMDAIFDAKDGDKSILVDKLGEFLIKDDTKAYDSGNKTAKELLVPSVADLLQNQSFKEDIDASIKGMAVSSNSDFQKSVREVMSQPVFEIPDDPNAALSWDF